MGGLLGFLFLTEIFLIVDNDLIPWVGRADLKGWIEFSPLNWTLWSHLVDVVTPLEAVGLLIYTFYFFFFLLASLILLVAMIGAIVLTLHKGVNVKREDVFQQNSREFGKTVRNIK